MRFWFSGEIHESVAESYRVTRIALERALNDRTAHAVVSPMIDEIAYLAIILPPGWEGDYPEVTRLSKKDRSLECRLKLDCGAFAGADSKERFDLLSDSLARIPRIAAEKKIPFDDTAYLGLLHLSCDDAKRG